MVEIPDDVAKAIADDLRRITAPSNYEARLSRKAWAALLDPKPPSLREQVIEALDEAGHGLGSATVFDIVVPLVAAVLDAQPLVDDYAAAVARGGTAVGSRRIQRDHDVRWLLSQLPASTDPHAYVGHSDRVCDLCGLPDRHPRHAVYTVTNAGTP